METPINPPTPQAGGSYLHDESTGTFTLVERTRERGEVEVGAPNTPADQAAPPAADQHTSQE